MASIEDSGINQAEHDKKGLFREKQEEDVHDVSSSRLALLQNDTGPPLQEETKAALPDPTSRRLGDNDVAGQNGGSPPGSSGRGALNAQLHKLSPPLKIVRVEGDGNCLFRAIAHQMDDDEDDHSKYRKQIVDHMEANPDTFKQFVEDETFESYLLRMHKEKTWGGNLELVAASQVLQADIHLHRLDQPVKVFECNGAQQGITSRQVNLSFQDGNHYNPVDLKTRMRRSTSESFVDRSLDDDARTRKQMQKYPSLNSAPTPDKRSNLERQWDTQWELYEKKKKLQSKKEEIKEKEITQRQAWWAFWFKILERAANLSYVVGVSLHIVCFYQADTLKIYPNGLPTLLLYVVFLLSMLVPFLLSMLVPPNRNGTRGGEHQQPSFEDDDPYAKKDILNWVHDDYLSTLLNSGVGTGDSNALENQSCPVPLQTIYSTLLNGSGSDSSGDIKNRANRSSTKNSISVVQITNHEPLNEGNFFDWLTYGVLWFELEGSEKTIWSKRKGRTIKIKQIKRTKKCYFRIFCCVAVPAAYIGILLELAAQYDDAVGGGYDIDVVKFFFLYVCGVAYGSFKCTMKIEKFGLEIELYKMELTMLQADIVNGQDPITSQRDLAHIAHRIRKYNKRSTGWSLYLHIHFVLLALLTFVTSGLWGLLLDFVDVQYACVFCYTQNTNDFTSGIVASDDFCLARIEANNGTASMELYDEGLGLQNEFSRSRILLWENLFFTLIVTLHTVLPFFYAAKLSDAQKSLLAFISTDMGSKCKWDIWNRSAFLILAKEAKLSTTFFGVEITRWGLLLVIPTVLNAFYTLFRLQYL